MSNLAADGQGNVYLAGLDPADQINHVETFSPTGTLLARWGEPGCEARSLAVDSQGRIYSSDGTRIQELAATGELLATWAAKGTDPGQFEGPMGIAVDARDNVYVTDSGNNRMQKLGAGR